MNVLGGHVDAEVDDLEAVRAEHAHDDVLADVVDVGLDGAEDDGAALASAPAADWSRPSSASARLEDLGRQDELGDEVLAGLVLVADCTHAVLQ